MGVGRAVSLDSTSCREEWRASIDLTTNIIYIFFCFSTFTQFHPVIMTFKIGSQVLDILQYEVHR